MARTEELEGTLGRSLRAVRIARRLTQAELADLANVSVGALKHLESGAGATTTTLVKVVRALGEERWLDRLAPAPAPFNPLELLDARKGDDIRPRAPQRVRRRPVGR
ncbi:MAG: helix-turn-helix domain-containing protein [Acidimicrobiales bacterium]